MCEYVLMQSEANSLVPDLSNTRTRDSELLVFTLYGKEKEGHILEVSL